MQNSLTSLSNTICSDEKLITSATTVKITEDTTIYAKWSLTPYYVHGYIGNTKVCEFTYNVETPASLIAYTGNGEYDFGGWYIENIYNPSALPSSPIVEYSDTTGSTITKVYALVKTSGLSISGNRVTGYSGSSANVIIPMMWDGNNIIEISEEAFYENDIIESIYAPFITDIGDSAFELCSNLTEFDLSNVQAIGARAFLGCGLTSVDLSSATSIGARAFMLSISLQEITLNDALSTPLGISAFANCPITVIHYSGSQSEFEALVVNNGNKNLTWDKVVNS